MSFQRVVHSDQTEETGGTKPSHSPKGPNEYHKNARLTPLRREEMAVSIIEDRLSQALAARVYGVSAKIVARWVERFKSEGRGHGRSLVPTQAIHRMTWQERLTGSHIAVTVGVSPATVSRVLKRAGLSRLKDIEPGKLHPSRYQDTRPFRGDRSPHRRRCRINGACCDRDALPQGVRQLHSAALSRLPSDTPVALSVPRHSFLNQSLVWPPAK
ncbi:hypothetical protein MESS4_20020 [Mesorhizobium sp. STM 4661]|nr:hypothetical protein MESS4_20020 [Mesorhizobium sp. STM 4661]